MDGRVISLVRLDQRSREARLMHATRSDLLAHVGDQPSATQLALIERAMQLRLRLALMDQQFADSGTMGNKATGLYLSLTNTYCRVMNMLGLKASPQLQPKPTLNGYLATRYGGRVHEVGEDGATNRATNGHASSSNEHAPPASRPTRTAGKPNGGNHAANGAKPPTGPRGANARAVPRRTLPR